MTMSDTQLQLNPIDTPFTVDDDEATCRRILADLSAIVRRVVPEVRQIARPVAVGLIGGFGRGEGGVLTRDGAPVPVNDYDLVVIVEPASLLSKRKIRRVLHGLSRELEKELGIAVDLDLRDENDLRRAPPTIAWYEVREGHKIIWGDGRALDAIPPIDPTRIEMWDGGFLLFNRTSGLLIAKKMLLDGGPKDEKEQTHFQVQLSKAALAWGDCVLIKERRYHLSYQRRMELAREADFSAAPHGERVRAEYLCALEMKIRPKFSEMPPADIAAMFESAVSVHEDFMRWFERARLGEVFETWRDYSEAKLVKLDMPPCRTSRLKNRIKNFLAFGLPVGPGEISRYVHPLVERLASVAPLLLFAKSAEDVAHAARILRLRDIPSDMRPETISRVTGRHISLWH